MQVEQKSILSNNIIPGIIIGGVIGILFGFFLRFNILTIPLLSLIFSSMFNNEIIGGIVFGVLIGGIIGRSLELHQSIKTTESKENTNKNVSLQIKEEQLSIAKKWISTGEVKITRATFLDEKTFTIPVKREELIIEKKSLVSTPEKDVTPELIRIPLSEERVEFTKHKVALEDVSVYKRQIQDIKHIEKTLRREEPKVKIFGSPFVREESDSKKS
jgi:uncharacterized protein (TIGR02271 family)